MTTAEAESSPAVYLQMQVADVCCLASGMFLKHLELEYLIRKWGGKLSLGCHNPNTPSFGLSGPAHPFMLLPGPCEQLRLQPGPTQRWQQWGEGEEREREKEHKLPEALERGLLLALQW